MGEGKQAGDWVYIPLCLSTEQPLKCACLRTRAGASTHRGLNVACMLVHPSIPQPASLRPACVLRVCAYDQALFPRLHFSHDGPIDSLENNMPTIGYGVRACACCVHTCAQVNSALGGALEAKEAAELQAAEHRIALEEARSNRRVQA